MKDAACMAVYGRRGSGKSTRVKAMLRQRSRIVVLDPQAEYEGRGWSRAETLRGVLAGLKRGWKRAFRISYVPTGNFPEALDKLAILLWQAQAPYGEGRDHRKLTLVVEEMNMSVPNHKAKRGLNAMLRLVLQGRHRGIEIIGITQRPALVSADFRGNVSDLCALPLSQALDYKAVLEIVGREHEARLRALDTHEFLNWSNGVVSYGRNALGRQKPANDNVNQSNRRKAS